MTWEISRLILVILLCNLSLFLYSIASLSSFSFVVYFFSFSDFFPMLTAMASPAAVPSTLFTVMVGVFVSIQ
jgi:hypothetical protein